MILTENYVLVNEIAKEHNIAISNFSPLANDDNLLSDNTIIKSGGTTVINKLSTKLPQYIRDLANRTKHTNLSGMIMVNDLKDNYYLNDAQISRIGTVVDIEKKKFVTLLPEYLEIFSNPKWVIYPITKDEIESVSLRDLIEKKQFKQIDKNTFLTWY